jgi:uncharacterized membrane protein YheB (UPF0754 family)
MNYWLLIIPAGSAFTGWFVIRVFNYFLFHPLQPKKVFGIKVQGIVPSKQKALARQLGQLSQQLFSFEAIENKINDPQNFQKIMPTIEKHIDDFLRHRLKDEMPMISMFIGDKTVNKMKAALMKEIETLFPQIMGQFAGNLKSEFNIGAMVEKKIMNYSTENVQLSFKQRMGGTITKAAWIAAGIGFIIGLIELLILSVFS